MGTGLVNLVKRNVALLKNSCGYFLWRGNPCGMLTCPHANSWDSKVVFSRACTSPWHFTVN